MKMPTQKPKNRFLPGAHISEAMLAKVLFCWLHGTPYSAIPTAISQDGSIVDTAMAKLNATLGEKYRLAENNKTNISRQSCHSIIAEISLHVISRNYKDRIPHFKAVLNDDDPFLKSERRRMIEVIGHEPPESERAAMIDEFRAQSVEDHIIRWGKIVLIISANVVPYDAMRAILGVKPFDLIQNPIILRMMQQRYRDFRGFKIPALKTHIAHYFCLCNGADYLRRGHNEADFESLYTLTQAEEAAYRVTITIAALACLLIQLDTGMSYFDLRKALFI